MPRPEYHNQAADTWISAHPLEYERLFDDGQIHGPELTTNTSIPEVALSAITRYTPIRGGSVSLVDYAINDEIANSVTTILKAASEGVFGPDHIIVEDSPVMSLAAFQTATSKTINRWSRVCRRRNLTSPFEGLIGFELAPEAIESDATQLVLMTAAAFAVVLKNHHAKSSSTLPSYARQGVKLYGPNFTNLFVEGSNPYELLPDKAAETLALINESGRKNLLSSSFAMTSLVASLDKVAKTLEAPSGEELATQLGWSVERTNSIFTPGTIKSLAFLRRDRPFMETAERVRYLYDEVFTPEAIASHLSITTDRAKATFKSSHLRQMVFRSLDSDPIDRLRDTLKLTRDLTNNYSLPYKLAVWLAVFAPKQAYDRAILIQEELPNCPPGVSRLLWSHAVARFPAKNEPGRSEFLVNSQAYWNLLNSLTSAPKLGADKRREDQYIDETFEAENMIFGDDASSNLRDAVAILLDRAGLTSADQSTLLDFFRDNDVDEAPPYIEELIKRVRNNAAS